MIGLFFMSFVLLFGTGINSFATQTDTTDSDLGNISKYVFIDVTERDAKKQEQAEQEKAETEKIDTTKQEQGESSVVKNIEQNEQKNVQTPAVTSEQNTNTNSNVNTQVQEPKVVEQPPAIIYNADGYEVVQECKDEVYDGLIRELKYDKHWIGRYYVIPLGGNVNVRSGPGFNYPVIKRALYRRKYTVAEVVKGGASKKNNSTDWYHIFWWKNGKVQYGYVYSGVVTKREFRFEYILEQVKKLRQEISQNTNTAYINNFKNRTGSAPKVNGTSNYDAYGIERYQAAPAYTSLEMNTSEMRYIQDGLMVAIEGEFDTCYKVRAYDFPGAYYVPKKYISVQNQVHELDQVIAVDIANQNEIVYEYRDGNWYVIGYSFATTGAKKSKYREPTIPGCYKIIQKKDEFLYIHDKEKYLDGYAPYALRFNGGAFIHGVPVGFIHEKETVEIEPAVLDPFGNVIKEAVTEEKVIPNHYTRPGHIEYSHTLGTVPLSHKCVRNATSFAKFLHGWAQLDKSSIMVVK